MEPIQPVQSSAPDPQPSPAPVAPLSPAAFKHSRKPLILTIGAVLMLLVIAGVAIAYITTRPQSPPQPTPTPAVVTGDIKQALPDIDSSLKEADVNISTITAGLNDVQGDLSE